MTVSLRESATPRAAELQGSEGQWLTMKAVQEALRQTSQRVAFSISGGGASGTWECGALAAWWKETSETQDRLRPQLIVGTSAGALNALTAWLDAVGVTPWRTSGHEFYGKVLWQKFGKNGGPYFVGETGSVVLSLFSKFLNRGPLRWTAVRALLGFVAIMLLDYVAEELTAVVADLLPAALETRHVHSLMAALRVSLILVLVGLWLGRSVFRSRRLESTVAATISHAPLRSRLRRKQIREAGELAIRAWRPGLPELLITTTNLTTRNATLFLAGSEETARELLSRGWHVHTFAVRGPERELPAVPWVDARDFVRCIAASTSIPGVFPSQRVRLYDAGSDQGVEHDLVDGGVLHNAPVLLAADAGASVVVSLELDPLLTKPPLRQDSRTRTGQRLAQPGLLDNVSETFSTLLGASITPDFGQIVAWNRHLRIDQPDLAPGAITRDGRRLVRLYRVAPFQRLIDTMEFNGTPGGYSLLQWMDSGEALVGAQACFWDATFQAAPSLASPNDQLSDRVGSRAVEV